MSDSIPTVTPIGFQPVTDELLRKVTERIVDALAPEQVILFGSYAYGKPTPDSDVDLLVVMDTPERSSRRRRAVSCLFRERPFPMDIVVRTPTEVKQALARVDPFIRDILRNGKVLYERPGRGARLDLQKSTSKPSSSRAGCLSPRSTT
jgi:predicted nucleotidyltransferase